MVKKLPTFHTINTISKVLNSSGKIGGLLTETLNLLLESLDATLVLLFLQRGNNYQVHISSYPSFDDKKLEDLRTYLQSESFVKSTLAFEFTNIVYREDIESSVRDSLENNFNISVNNIIRTHLLSDDSESQTGSLLALNIKPDSNDAAEEELKNFVESVANNITLAISKAVLAEESNRVSQLLGMGKLAHDIKNLTFALGANVNLSDYVLHDLKDKLEKEGWDKKILSYVQSIDDMMGDLHESIDRVQRYSTLISDLAAGKKLTPTLKLGPMAQSVQLGAAYLESEGREQHVAIRYHIQNDAPPVMHDEMYIVRIVQNLVSNAIHASSMKIGQYKHIYKNVQEFEILSYVHVVYKYEKPYHIIEVQDFGIGMSEKTAEKILAGKSTTSWENHRGSGWGTKIALELAATHHASASIESELGRGTTFRLEIPEKIEE